VSWVWGLKQRMLSAAVMNSVNGVPGRQSSSRHALSLNLVLVLSTVKLLLPEERSRRWTEVLQHRLVSVLACCIIQKAKTLLSSSDTVSFTFTYHTWQFIIIIFLTIFTITACIFSYSFSLSLWTKDLALRQIISSIDLFLSYRPDSTDSRTI